MPKLDEAELTRLTDREIAASGIGSSPAALRAYRDLQTAVYELQPFDTAAVQSEAAAAAELAENAGDLANTAQATGELAQGTADSAMTRADDAYDLADTKVTKNAGPTFAAPVAAPARTALPAYTGGAAAVAYDQAEITALKAQVATLTSIVAGLITDLRANGALKAT